MLVLKLLCEQHRFFLSCKLVAFIDFQFFRQEQYITMQIMQIFRIFNIYLKNISFITIFIIVCYNLYIYLKFFIETWYFKPIQNHSWVRFETLPIQTKCLHSNIELNISWCYVFIKIFYVFLICFCISMYCMTY